MNKFEWEISFPRQCPLNGAIQNDHKNVHRLVRDKHLKEKEFYPNNMTPGGIIDLTDCKRWAVSFFYTYNGADYIRNTIPHFRNHKIAIGNLLSTFGTSLVDGNDHISLWRFEQIKIKTHFKVI